MYSIMRIINELIRIPYQVLINVYYSQILKSDWSEALMVDLAVIYITGLY